MKSPFPGMDPYIEGRGLWEDFHGHLIESIHHYLADAVPERYLVRAGERSYHVLIESEKELQRPLVPDVKIMTGKEGKKARKKPGGAAVAELATTDEPMTLRAFIVEEHRESFVEIYEDDPELRLVTTIEVLSPSNKRPGTRGWELFQRKRQSALLGGVNLIEIDLLRGGRRPPMLDPWPDCPYTLLVGRANRNHVCRVWPAYFDRPLPEFPVPLAPPDTDVRLSLQPMIEAIYVRCRYARSIDYTKPSDPPLNTEEMSWLKARLRERQGRS